MKKLFLLLAVCFIASCGYAEDYCHGPSDPDINRCYAAINCAGPEEKFYGREFDACIAEYDAATVQTTVEVQEASEARVKANTYCKKHLKARGNADDFAQCIAEMTAYLEENEQ